MILKHVFARGFRCFGDQNPLDLELRPGINLLVGENDSGKSAVVDAIRLALGARSEDAARVTEDDFHVGPAGRVADLVIRCTLDDLSKDELLRFVEWCVIEDERPRLHVHVSGSLRSTRNGNSRAWCDHRAGRAGDGPAIDGPLREYLRVAYLRPLRDAERQLRAGRRSRLSQILLALPQMAGQGRARADTEAEDEAKQTLGDLLVQTREGIQANPAIAEIEHRLNESYLRNLLFDGDGLAGRIDIGFDLTLVQILERLELLVESVSAAGLRLPHGLGINNVLFMAAELLLLQSGDEQVPTLIIEEPEAHLHPQLQGRFMAMLGGRLKETPQSQVILTTHSPLLAAGVDLEAVVLCRAGRLFALSSANTMLAPGDYGFLRRFLDSTKANLFFARGVLVVEGDAENLLLPILAEKLGTPLAAHGVSIVKVGHTGLFRYSRIFQRRDARVIPIPVACLADRDIPPDEARGLDGARPKKTASDLGEPAITARMKRLRLHEADPVRVFISDHWTLEYDLAAAGLAVELHQAVGLVERRERLADTAAEGAAIAEVLEARRSEVERWRGDGRSAAQIARDVFKPMYCEDVSKAEVAEQLAALLVPLDARELESRIPRYIRDAIAYVTQPLVAAAATPIAPGVA